MPSGGDGGQWLARHHVRDVTPTYAFAGCLTIDSVLTASGQSVARICGGNSLYAAVGAHIWDSRVGIVARAGNDYPEACLGAMAAALDIRGVRRLSTPHGLRVAFAYRDDGSRTRLIPPALLDTLDARDRPDFVDNTHDDRRYLAFSPSPGDIPPSWLADVPAVHLPALLVQSHRALLSALHDGRGDRLVTIDSPWYDRRDASSDRHVDLLREVDAVLPSEEDLTLFRPNVPILEAARHLIDYGARVVVVKIAADGSLVVDRNGDATHVPAYPARTVDPTGAGDSYCGGFLVGLRETGDAIQAAMYGTVSASFVVEDRGPIPVLAVQRGQAQARMAEIADVVRRGIKTDPRGTRT